MNQKKKRLPVRGIHASSAAKGEQLKNQGKQDFESVYGSKTPAAFNMTEDIQAMTGVIHMPEETKNLTRPKEEEAVPQPEPVVRQDPVKAGFSMPEPTTNLPLDMPVVNMGPQNDEAPEEEEEEEVELTVEEKCKKLFDFVVSVTGKCPPVQTLLAWKQMHGDIFMLHLGERVFLFRYLKRQELIQIKANPQYDQLPELKREEDIYHRCVLYPNTDVVQESSDPAGLMGMLAKQIKMQSMFLDEMYVAQLVLKI